MSVFDDPTLVEDFHAALKSATDSKHRELEGLPISQQLADGSISLHDYLGYLSAMHDFVGSVEQKALPVIGESLPDAGLRLKTDWLAQDLGKSAGDFSDLFDDFPWTEAFAMGVFYVLEGSTLGGRFIQARLAQTGHIPAEKMRFFQGYGNQSGAMWKKFLHSLSRFAGTSRQDQIIEGANFAFDTIKKHLGQISA